MPPKDIAAQMYARRQIDDASFLAAKAYRSDQRAKIEARIVTRFGREGLELMRDVLGSGMTLEHAARERGEVTKHDVGWWGGLFRACLRSVVSK